MSDNGPVIRVTFYGGPADGGELDLLEPLPPLVVFPMTAVRAAVLLAQTSAGGKWFLACPRGDYKLVHDGNRLLRDSRRRVVYAYVPAVAPATPGNPTEGDTHE